MRLKKQKVFRTVTEAEQEIFDKKCNEILRELIDAEYHFNEVPGKLSVTIIGTSSVEIPESISEEYEIKGEVHYCADCKFYEPSKDRRIKYVNCPHSSCGVSAGMRACDFFYTMLEAGEEIFK